MIDLSAIALRRAEEQVGVRFGRLKPVGSGLGRCLCGRCKRCKNRKWMREWRDENNPGGRVTCVHCGRARNLRTKTTQAPDPLGWCSRCRRNSDGAEYRRQLAAVNWDGGGI